MANSNFVVQNGLTVGTTTIFAGNGDITTTGNITVSGGGSFGGFSTHQVYQGASNVTVSGSFVNVSIGSTNVASFSSTGLTVLGTTTTVQNETVQGSLTPSSNIAYNLGSSSQYWSNGWIGQVTANTVTATTIGGTLSTAAQPNITSHGTLTGLTVSGATQTAAITSSGTIIAATVNAATIGNSGATLTGTLQTAAQPNITTLAGVTSIGASGSTTLTGTLQTAAQTNITSVGTLTGLTVSGAIIPNSNVTVNLGSTSAWWNNIYGTAVHAQYADLAEKYLADKEYEIGTVVAIGGEAEVTACSQGDRAIGAVSANPAYAMNSGLDGGTYIALKGRVPIKVEGPVRKGQRLVAGDWGCACAINNSDPDVFAVALETNNNTGVNLVEALIL